MMTLKEWLAAEHWAGTIPTFESAWNASHAETMKTFEEWFHLRRDDEISRLRKEIHDLRGELTKYSLKEQIAEHLKNKGA